jgi:hypothetical protein
MEENTSYGFSIYAYTWGIIIFCSWAPFCLAASLSIVNTGRLAPMAGPLAAVLIRGLVAWKELGKLRKFINHRAFEYYVHSFKPAAAAAFSRHEEEDQNPTCSPKSTILDRIYEKVSSSFSSPLSSSPSLQFAHLHLSAALLLGISSLVLGSRIQNQRWAIWIGAAVVVEVGVRLLVEAVWRGTRVGRTGRKWGREVGICCR